MNLWVVQFSGSCEDSGPNDVLNIPRKKVFVATVGDALSDVKAAIIKELSEPPASNVQVFIHECSFMGEVWVNHDQTV